MTAERFIPMPTTGKVEFDFSFPERPDHANNDPDDMLPIPDAKLVRVLATFGLIENSERDKCEQQVHRVSIVHRIFSPTANPGHGYP